MENEIKRLHAERERVVLGLATGRSPAGMYKHLAKAANTGRIDATRLMSFNLDEYVGLPGENAQQRALHQESYSYYMIRDFFGLLHANMIEVNVPWGTLIEQTELVRALAASRHDWHAEGDAGGLAGKAIVIHREALRPLLRWVRREILDGYEKKIRRAGGIDVQVVGVGSKGHVAFHEAGIPFAKNRMLLVKLDDRTVSDAVTDGHFSSKKDCPLYAISMGVELVFKAPKVVLLASGPRKVAAIERSIFEEPSPALPLSYVQRYVERGGDLVYVVDKKAAAGILGRTAELKERKIALRDLSAKRAKRKVDDIHFHIDPLTGLMT